MSTCMLNHRRTQHQNLSDFTEKIHQEIMDIRSVLGWTVESIEIENDNRLICPYNSSHRVGKEMLDQHLEHCQWKEDGYNNYDLPLSEPNSHLYSPFSIKLDADLQNSIIKEVRIKDPTISVECCECHTWHKHYSLGDRLIPQTSDRIFTDFTRDERKTLYEYVVSRTMKVDVGHDFTDTDTPVYQDKNNKQLSFLELLVQERNLKRRRAKHRGVHTNKKSHMEILREIIDQQMELYIDHITQEHRIDRDSKPVDLGKTESAKKHLGDTVQNASSSLPADSPYTCRNFLRTNSQHYHGFSSFRNDRDDASHTNTFKDRHKRDKYSRSSTESRKTQKQRKHKRSRSRERDYSKKYREEFAEKAYTRGVTKYDETDRINDAGY